MTSVLVRLKAKAGAKAGAPTFKKTVLKMGYAERLARAPQSALSFTAV